MRHRPHRHEPVAHRGGDVRGPARACDRRCPRRLHRRVGAVIAARREVDQPLARRRSSAGCKRDPRRLRRHHRLEVDLVEQQRLEQLRLNPRRGDANQRLAGERDRPLRHRVDVAREAKPRQVLEEGRAEPEPSEGSSALLPRTPSPAPAPAPDPARPPAATGARAAAGGRTARTPRPRSSPVAGSSTPSPARTDRSAATSAGESTSRGRWHPGGGSAHARERLDQRSRCSISARPSRIDRFMP